MVNFYSCQELSKKIGIIFPVLYPWVTSVSICWLSSFLLVFWFLPVHLRDYFRFLVFCRFLLFWLLGFWSRIFWLLVLLFIFTIVTGFWFLVVIRVVIYNFWLLVLIFLFVWWFPKEKNIRFFLKMHIGNLKFEFMKNWKNWKNTYS